MLVRSSLKFLCLALLLCTGAVHVFSQSPRKLAFVHGGGAVSGRIAVINEDGTGQVIFSDGGDDRDPSWSPDGSELVFSGPRFGGINIVRMKADGTGQVPLTDTLDPVLNIQPVWSPDATRIAFVSNRTGSRRAEIWLMNADGTNPVRLTENIQLGTDSFGPFYGTDSSPAWSPDGTKIAFSSTRNGTANPEIYVMNADGSNQTRLTNNTFEDNDPFWVRGGGRITYWSRRSGQNGIWEINQDGSSDHQITTGFQGDWSPDGHRLALTDFDTNARAVFLTDEEGDNRVRLTNNGFLDSSAPVWQTLGGPVPPPPPPQPTFTVTGTVFDNSGVTGAVPGVTITLSGSSMQSTITDADGKFAFANLPLNGTFTVTPSSPNWRFFPTSSSFNTIPPLFGFAGKNTDLRFDATPIWVQFNSATYHAVESTKAIISVERIGSVVTTSTIQYTASSGTAVVGEDFVATTGTLTFNPGDSTKSFEIPLIYDKKVEQPETVTLTLTNPTGGLARGRQTAELIISDPPPLIVMQPFTNLAAAINADTFVRDPFPLTTTSMLDPTQILPTRVAFFVQFVDLVAGEDSSAVTVTGFNFSQATFNLPVEFVGKVPGFDDLTQINVRLPDNLPAGDLFLRVRLRGNDSANLTRIRITQ
jgi:hypothetical protein